MINVLRKLFPIVLLTIVGNSHLWAQEQGKLLTTHYMDEDYMGHPQNLEITFDDNGILHLGNSASGIIAYDGKSWQKLPGISKAIRSFAKTSDGTIYVGSHNELGYIERNSKSTDKYVSLKPLLDSDHKEISVIWHIHTIDQTVYFYSNETLYIFKDGVFEYIPLEKKYYRQFKVGSNIYLNNKSTRGIDRLEGSRLVPINIKDNPLKKLIAEILPYDKEHHLIVSRYEGVFLFNLEHNTLQLVEGSATPILKNDRINCAILQDNGDLILGSAFSGIFIVDAKSNLLRKIDKSTGLIDLTIWKLEFDQSKNLWAATNNGTTKIEVNTGLEYWDNKSGLTGTPLSIQRINGQLFVPSPTGVFQLKDQQFIKISNLDYFTNQLIQLTGIPALEGLVLAGSDRGIFRIDKNVAYNYLPESAYLFHQYTKDPSYLFISDFDSEIKLYYFDGLKWQLKYSFDDLKKKGAWSSSIIEDKVGNLWVATEESGVIQIKNPIYPSQATINFFTEGENLSTEFAYSLSKKEDGFILYSQNGFYNYNGSKNIFEKDSALSYELGFTNPNISVYPLSIQKNGNFWLAAQKKGRTMITGAIKQKDNSFELDTIGTKRITTKSINAIYPEDNYVWIGTPDRIYRYNTRLENNSATNGFNAVINRINIGMDSLHFRGHLISSNNSDSTDVFTYENQFFRFTFGATSYFEENNILFSYKLNGFNDNWSEWSTDEYKEFSNLPEGAYNFELKAKNIFGTESSITSYSFKILPPWHRTLWAYFAYVILCALFIHFLIKVYHSQLKKENENLESEVQLRTREVQQQKKSLEKSNQQLKSTIDKLTQAQSQLIQSEKMASLGQLTAGIAHEINNPINYISSSAEALRLDYEDIRKIIEKIIPLKINEYQSKDIDEIIKLKEALELDYTLTEMNQLFQGIEEGSNRTQEIVKSLRIFSRNTSESFHLANINEGIASTLLILNNQLGIDIKLEKKYGRLPLVNCQISKLNQVFLNIIVNALHAIENRPNQHEPGIIIIETSQFQEEVIISFKDNGMGMDIETSNKVFEPFFTTKEVGKGTGLGLSVSYGIIKDHQGSIEVVSELGKGTTFSIKIPIQPEGRDEG